MWPGPRPVVSIPRGILIRPTVWPQIHKRHRQDRQLGQLQAVAKKCKISIQPCSKAPNNGAHAASQIIEVCLQYPTFLSDGTRLLHVIQEIHQEMTKRTFHDNIFNHFYEDRPGSYTEFVEITHNKGHYAVQAHSRSPILVPIESLYTTSC